MAAAAGGSPAPSFTRSREGERVIATDRKRAGSHWCELESARAANSVLPSPLRGGSARRAGVGVVRRRTDVASHHDPHPQSLPARGRGADRARGVIVHQQKKKLPYPGLFATPASAKVAMPA